MSAEVKLHCVGTGDAFGSGGRLNSCFHLQAEGEQILIDCGCSSLIGLQRCGIDPAGIDAVIISHLHGDHFGGIPFLLLEAKFVSCRQRPLTLIGPSGLQRQVETTLETLYPGIKTAGLDFPLIYRQLNPAENMQQGTFTVSSCQVKHGRSREVYAVRIDVAGKALCYSGDTEWTDALIDLSADSDLLIAECFAYDRPVAAHLDYQTLLAQRNNLKSKRLMLTHMGPDMLAKIAELEMETVNDGDVIYL